MAAACRESSDHGAFNAWDRLPYITTVRKCTQSTVPKQNNFHHNFIVAMSNGSHADAGCFCFDDGTSYYDVHHNLCWYGGFKTMYGGHSHAVYSNYFISAMTYGFRCIYMMEPTQQLGPDGAALYQTQYYNNTCSVAAVVPKPDCCDTYTTRALYATFDGSAKNWQSLLNRSVRLYNNSIYIQPPPPPPPPPPPAAASNGSSSITNMSVITLNGQGDGPFLSPDGLVLTMEEFQVGGYDEGSTVVAAVPTIAAVTSWAHDLLGISR